MTQTQGTVLSRFCLDQTPKKQNVFIVSDTYGNLMVDVTGPTSLFQPISRQLKYTSNAGNFQSEKRLLNAKIQIAFKRVKIGYKPFGPIKEMSRNLSRPKTTSKINSQHYDNSRGRIMGERAIYKITITNFKKHNATLKKGHKATLISHNFCQDAKLSTVPLTTRWLFLNLLLTCGDMHSDTVELSEKALRDMLECRRNIVRVLASLQELQLLTFEKITPFIIEKKRREEKRIEEKVSAPPAERQTPPTKISFEVVEAFKDDPTLAPVLQYISTAVQKSWVNRYEKTWLRKTLLDAVSHHLAKANVEDPAQIDDWGLRLTRWLRREKKPSLLETGNSQGQSLEEFARELDEAEGRVYGAS